MPGPLPGGVVIPVAPQPAIANATWVVVLTKTNNPAPTNASIVGQFPDEKSARQKAAQLEKMTPHADGSGPDSHYFAVPGDSTGRLIPTNLGWGKIVWVEPKPGKISPTGIVSPPPKRI